MVPGARGSVQIMTSSPYKTDGVFFVPHLTSTSRLPMAIVSLHIFDKAISLNSKLQSAKLSFFSDYHNIELPAKTYYTQYKIYKKETHLNDFLTSLGSLLRSANFSFTRKMSILAACYYFYIKKYVSMKSM